MNQLDLNGRNAVVTGGASGLGLAIAERLVASGAKVVIWDLNGEAAHAAGKKLGGSSVAADVSNLTSVMSAVEKTLGIVPTIDILINNAGISGPNAKLWEYPVDDWQRIFAVNVEGTFYCCRTVVPTAIRMRPPIAPARPPSLHLQNRSGRNWPILQSG